MEQPGGPWWEDDDNSNGCYEELKFSLEISTAEE